MSEKERKRLNSLSDEAATLNGTRLSRFGAQGTWCRKPTAVTGVQTGLCWRAIRLWAGVVYLTRRFEPENVSPKLSRYLTQRIDKDR